MNAGPSGDQEPVEARRGPSSPSSPSSRCSWREPDAKVRDHRIGLVFAGIAVAALLVGGLIALVLAMAG